MALTRRALLGGTAAAAALGLAGCSGLTPGRDPGGTLSFWNLFGGGDGLRLTQMLDAYRAANRGVSLEAVTLAWGNPYYTKLSLATLGDKPPDVAVSHLTRAKTLISAGLLEELKPEDLARHGLDASNFTARPWEAGLVDGKAYAIPIDTHPFVMFYNTDICQKAGLLDSAGALLPLDTPEKFTEAMKKAKDVTKAYGGVVAIDNDVASPWRIYQSLYSQLGGETLADEGTKVVIDEARATQALAFLQGLTRDGLMPGSIDYQGAIATFANGQSGFYFQGEWEISTFQTAKLPFSMTSFPNIFGGGKYAVQADSHTLVIPKQPDQDQANIDRSLAFIRFLLDQSKTWAEGGHVPAWKPFLDSPEYKAMTPQSNYAAAADGAVYDPDGWYSGSGSNFEIVTSAAIGSVLAGRAAPAAAVAQMRSDLTSLAKTASPV
ncbi:extracellular solute-binding protein [Winogradskya consettensis]|uniref:Sugar ABC transporter substrate-binding protein n=1 Tax=Winogradskya consettensis TaxID=113560 RepID=A0A919T334_9ACTN|nr:extracellular solute-binding protein [Actinoplanes consettensis]GIM85484.1 sugar ABC transporter substrate-binding protein [Actinoplanes consettensis]